MTIAFLVRPMDWVAFGPPRSSDAGESHHRGTDFPPTPTAFQGIVRTALLRAAGMDLLTRSSATQAACEALVGSPGALPPGWQMRGPFATEVVTRNGRRLARPWVVTPRHVLRVKGRAAPAYARPVCSPALEASRPAALNDVARDRDPILLGRPELDDTKPLGGWLSPRGLLWALSGDEAPAPWHAADHQHVLPPFVAKEHLPGLAIDSNTGTAEDGMLFFGEVLRFAASSGLAGWLSASLPTDIPADALTRGDIAGCGWKSRPAILEALPDVDPVWSDMLSGRHLPNAVAEDQGFFLVALTPARCHAGTPARASIEDRLRTTVRLPPRVRIVVLASLTGPPRVIGGLEAASRRPRENRSYWDAGSAWLFVLRGGTEAERAAALLALHNCHPLGERKEAQFGYGHTLVGVGPAKVDPDSVKAAERRQEGGR